MTNPADPSISRLVGQYINHYQVVSLLGKGGMGEVYRARDTKLGRDVAIKVLPAAFISNPERVVRFHREARTLAMLNHPSIAAIYGFEDGPVPALVLEMVEGETLADRIQKGPLHVAEALQAAREIAEALNAAHEKGIIHRDLKPANVKITSQGAVKVLDFGLAKALENETAGSSEFSVATADLTARGLIQGTPAYMSPEQARGQMVDHRADIWAFGCVLYEMLTGRPAFAGETITDCLSAVVGKEPDWTALASSVPASIRMLLRRCLEKDLKRRVASVSTVLFIMDEPSMALPADAAVPVNKNWKRATVLLALAFVTVVLASMLQTEPAIDRRVRRLTLTLEGVTPGAAAAAHVQISPDGNHIAYRGGGGSQLFSRPLDQLEALPLGKPGLPGAFCFSPDGQSIAFIEYYVLKRVSAGGGAATSLGDYGGGNAVGMDWGEGHSMVIATDANSTGLIEIPETGGELKVLTRPDRERGEIDHFWPEYLPGAKVILFTVLSTSGIDNAHIAAFDTRTGQTKTLIRGGSGARYVPGGYLVYATAGTLRAVGFDLERLEVRGTPVTVVPQVMSYQSGLAQFSVASDGTLLYIPGQQQAPRSILVWVDRSGREEPIPAPPRVYMYPRISPDGKHVALDIRDQQNDIWLWNFARQTLTRITTDPSLDRFPVWTPDGKRLLYGSDRAGPPQIYWQTSDGTGTAEQLSSSSTSEHMPMSVEPNGRWLVFRDGLPQRFDLALLSLDSEHRIRVLVNSAFSEQNAEVSPNGRWVAYQSNESGQFDVYVRPFPDAGSGRWMVSPGGGAQPLWSRDGSELFYVSPSLALMRVGVENSGSWTATSPAKLFEGPYSLGGREAFGRSYDVSPDGKRFLMIRNNPVASPATSTTVVVVLNWLEELKARVH